MKIKLPYSFLSQILCMVLIINETVSSAAFLIILQNAHSYDCGWTIALTHENKFVCERM